MGVLGPLLLLVHLGTALTGVWRPSHPRLQFSHTELVKNSRLLTLPFPAGDLHSLLTDEDSRRLYAAMKDNLLATSLDDITRGPRKVSTCRVRLSPHLTLTMTVNLLHKSVQV
ncbi:semaphorin-3G isoform X1 [Arapaima gigas]